MKFVLSWNSAVARLQPNLPSSWLLMMAMSMNTSGAIAAEAEPDYGLRSTQSVIATSHAGDKLASKPNVDFQPGIASGAVRVLVDPKDDNHVICTDCLMLFDP